MWGNIGQEILQGSGWESIVSCRTRKGKKKKKNTHFLEILQGSRPRWWECIASCRTGLVRDKEEPSYY